MAFSISTSFTSVTSGAAVYVKHGDSFSYAVSGTFVGTVQLQKSQNNGTSWELVVSATGSASGTLLCENPGQGAAHFRFVCTAYTSGTIVTSITEVAQVVQEFKNRNGQAIVTIKEDGLYVANEAGTTQFSALTSGVGAAVRSSQQIVIAAAGKAKVGGTSGWAVAPADNLAVVTLPQSQTASTLVVPVTGLKVGQTITAFSLVGQIESGGNAVTVDANLRKMTAAAADVTDASVASITQISVTADAIISASKSSLSQAVAADESYYILITATTGASCDIALQAVTVTVTEA